MKGKNGHGQVTLFPGKREHLEKTRAGKEKYEDSVAKPMTGRIRWGSGKVSLLHQSETQITRKGIVKARKKTPPPHLNRPPAQGSL